MIIYIVDIPALIHHLEKLRHFSEVAHRGSFSRAATVLGISQPSLSVSIRILEDAVESPLFTRSKKGVELTAPGQILLKYADRVLDGATECLEHIHSQRPFSEINIVTHESLVPELWPGIVSTTTAMPAKLNLTTSDSTNECRDLVLSNECQIGISAESSNIERDNRLFALPLITDYFCFVCARQSTFVGAKITPSSDLPLLYLPQMIVGENKTLRPVLEEMGMNRKPRYNVSTISSVKTMTLMGLGIGILPKFLLKREFSQNDVVELKSSIPIKSFTKHRLLIFCRDDFQKRLKLRAFSRDLKKDLENAK